ncbi:hypothetical protein NDU88_005758 [Pleurodeles waltl]|uniref:Uncharacterized protein n=1 Tax=Pleurodeles waltl TaxID=8319 RepID=A0AAV7NXH3_PLEWA|nr:hypothetical protein NDU88_005758 [Pleurodeles waltl]
MVWDYSKVPVLGTTDPGSKLQSEVDSEALEGLSLGTIYQSIMAQRDKTKAESRKAQAACRKMQLDILRVAKSCSEFREQIGEAENHTLEDDLSAQKEASSLLKVQVEDTQ